MMENLKLLATVSRTEFLLPNLVSLTFGLSWSVKPPISLTELLVPAALAFMVINLSSAIGAQVNTVSDYSLDSKDARKKKLVESLNHFGQNRLKVVLVVESISALALCSLLAFLQGKPALLLLWIAGIVFGCAYSASPTRLKARSWFALGSLILALSILPVVFVFYTFASELNLLFAFAVIGLTLTIYGLIVPTEIRDYFGDRAMKIETMTVHLGLTKATLLSIAFLSIGGILTGAAFFLELAGGQYWILSVSVFAIAAADYVVLKKYRQLYSLAEKYTSSGENPVAENIVALAAHNPHWIMLVTQTYSIVAIILLLSRFLS